MYLPSACDSLRMVSRYGTCGLPTWLHFVFPHHAVDDDFQMQLTHAADDGLPGIRIGGNFEGRIFLRQG